MKRAALIACMSLAAGCTTFPQVFKQTAARSSYVAPEVSHAEYEKIARDMARFLSAQLPPAKTTIELDPSGTSFHDIFFNELVWRGFGVVESKPEDGENTVPLRYFVTILDTGIVVRMKYSQQVAGRFYNRTGAGQLSFASAYAVREATK